MYRVLVMMSTYNGEQFLEEQLLSILENCNDMITIDMIIRDDGSSDKTKEIINKYRESLKISYFEGSNLKPAQSFRKLVQIAPMGYDAYAYADQDDVWDKDKMVVAIKELSKYPDETVLWCCGVELLENGRVVGSWACNQDRVQSLPALLFTGSGTNGCSMIFNCQLMKALKDCMPGLVDMHDSWTNMVCLSVGGRVLCEEKPFVQYRIHDKQVTGKRTKLVRSRINRILHPSRLRSKTAENLLTNKAIIPVARDIITVCAEYRKWKNKRTLLLTQKPSCLSYKEFLKFKIQVLLNAY